MRDVEMFHDILQRSISWHIIDSLHSFRNRRPRLSYFRQYVKELLCDFLSKGVDDTFEIVILTYADPKKVRDVWHRSKRLTDKRLFAKLFAIGSACSRIPCR